MCKVREREEKGTFVCNDTELQEWNEKVKGRGFRRWQKVAVISLVEYNNIWVWLDFSEVIIVKE